MSATQRSRAWKALQSLMARYGAAPSPPDGRADDAEVKEVATSSVIAQPMNAAGKQKLADCAGRCSQKNALEGESGSNAELLKSLSNESLLKVAFSNEALSFALRLLTISPPSKREEPMLAKNAAPTWRITREEGMEISRLAISMIKEFKAKDEDAREAPQASEASELPRRKKRKTAIHDPRPSPGAEAMERRQSLLDALGLLQMRRDASTKKLGSSLAEENAAQIAWRGMSAGEHMLNTPGLRAELIELIRWAAKEGKAQGAKPALEMRRQEVDKCPKMQMEVLTKALQIHLGAWLIVKRLVEKEVKRKGKKKKEKAWEMLARRRLGKRGFSKNVAVVEKGPLCPESGSHSSRSPDSSGSSRDDGDSGDESDNSPCEVVDPQEMEQLRETFRSISPKTAALAQAGSLTMTLGAWNRFASPTRWRCDDTMWLRISGAIGPRMVEEKRFSRAISLCGPHHSRRRKAPVKAAPEAMAMKDGICARVVSIGSAHWVGAHACRKGRAAKILVFGSMPDFSPSSVKEAIKSVGREMDGILRPNDGCGRLGHVSERCSTKTLRESATPQLVTTWPMQNDAHNCAPFTLKAASLSLELSHETAARQGVNLDFSSFLGSGSAKWNIWVTKCEERRERS